MSGLKLRSVKNLQENKSRSQSRVSFKEDNPGYLTDEAGSSRGDDTIITEAPKETIGGKRMREEKNTPVGPFKRFARGVRGFWDTTVIVDGTDSDREAFVRTTLRELFVYLGFVLTICLIAFLMLDSTMYYLTKVMQGLFVDGPNFDSLDSMEKFWNYVEKDLIDGLYKEQNYDGSDVHHQEIGYIFFENKLFGRPRLRQLRVRNDTCKIHKDMVNEFDRCFGPYSYENEEQINFRNLNGTAWNYNSSEALDGRDFLGRRGKYGGGGYTQLLSDNKLESQAIVAALKKNMWIDRGTRVVFVDFTVYNANINMFNIVRLLFEFTPTGGAITFRKLVTVKLLRYVTATDYFVMACEGILLLYLIFYIIEELLEMRKLKLKYLKDFWSYFDWSVILFGLGCLVLNLYRTFTVGTVLKDILDNRDKFANFELLQYWQELFNDLIAVTCFLAWVKIFKYIQFNQTMAHLQGTLSRSAKDVAAFAFVFSIIFVGFAHWGYLCFGKQARDFNEFVICLFTLFRIILGDFNFNDIYEANWIFGPVYFVAYIFFVFFVLLNMFLAIINDTYAEVKEDMDDEEIDVGSIFKKGYDKMLNSLAAKKNTIVDIKSALVEADTNDDDMIDFEEWRSALKARGHHDAEIEAVFAKFDKDGDRVLNAMEQKAMLNEFEAETEDIDEEIEEIEQKKTHAKKLFSKLDIRDEYADDDDDDDSDTDSEDTQPRYVGTEEFKILIRRVNNAEQSVGSIVSKIEAVLNKLETMDRAKAKRRETMARLIDSITEYEDKVEGAEELLKQEVMASSGTLKSQTKTPKGSIFLNTPKGSSFLRPKSSKRSKASKDSLLSIKLDS